MQNTLIDLFWSIRSKWGQENRYNDNLTIGEDMFQLMFESLELGVVTLSNFVSKQLCK